MRDRATQVVLIGATLIICWLGMQIVHEAGNVLAGLFLGVSIDHVVLHPLAISYTRFVGAPPVAAIWAGSLFGMFAPLACYGGWAFVGLPGGYLWRVFAAFCLIANGGYLIGGTIASIGDPGDLLAAGIPAWRPLLVGVLALAPGIWMLRGQGEHFGLRQTDGKVNVDAAYVMAFICMTIVVLEFTLGGRIEFTP